MKKSSVLGMLLIGLLIISCSKDDPMESIQIPDPINEVPVETPVEIPEEQTPTGKFQVDGVDYPVPFGYMRSEPRGTLMYMLNADFIGDIFDDFDCAYSNDFIYHLYLEVIEFDLNQVEDGSYSFAIVGNESSQVHVEITIDGIVENGCLQSYDSLVPIVEIISGDLQIEKSGDFYTLNFTMETTNSGIITGNYEGVFKLFPELI